MAFTTDLSSIVEGQKAHVKTGFSKLDQKYIYDIYSYSETGGWTKVRGNIKGPGFGKEHAKHVASFEDLPTVQEITREKAAKQAGETWGVSEKSLSELDIGMGGIKAKDFLGKNPKDAAEEIFQKQYSGIVPEGFTNKDDFINSLISQFSALPKLGEVSEEEVGFLKTGRELSERRAGQAYEQDIYGLQKQAEMMASVGRSSLGTGMGIGERGEIAGQAGLGQTFGQALETKDISEDVADLGYESGMYGLTSGVEQAWESNFSEFLKQLPPVNV